jgi:predicted DCC family thiol-disulfide oxidoreductase YuxK
VTGICIYDGDCGFCSRCVDWASRRSEVKFVPFQRTDLATYGVTEEAAAEAVHFVGDDGRVVRGAAAVAAVFSTCGGGWPLVGKAMRLPGIRGLAEIVYRLIARNRYRLPGPAACSIDPPK